ncbi:hypothetical protein MS3_00003063 [Schistosoma haematobium]|uniref:Uncharacterized protein n=1 Tax=Schistosoma haematobium TaxID=6185 RepID=A0A922LNB6_SCHHA|nr:hypothetical protein MS3_00003063 [Schistosoma haematobium]KAH9590333.1 hypothetical protein MS3_00003063 [Schistosoma haematobium]
MININTRSVLRPEYLYHSFNFSAPSTLRTYDGISSKINTNTAPVYCLEGKSHVKRLRPDNKRVHPYKKPCGDYATSTTNLPDQLLWPRTSNKSDSSDSEGVSPENSSSPSLSYVSRFCTWLLVAIVYNFPAGWISSVFVISIFRLFCRQI